MPMVENVLRCRNDAVAEQALAASGGGDDESAALFGDTACTKSKKPARLNAAKLQEMRDAPGVMEFSVPGVVGSPALNVSTIRPAHPCDDPFVPLDPDSIEHIVRFMRESGIDHDSLMAKRHYGSTGSKGLWRNGGSLVVQSIDPGSEQSCDDDAEPSGKRSRKLKKVKADGGDSLDKTLGPDTPEACADILFPIANA